MVRTSENGCNSNKNSAVPFAGYDLTQSLIYEINYVYYTTTTE